ncbi:hypothetical protein F5Y14DRAFT_434535 [Nemania sp. NC0429]|nr:hypothetical protein F5Y14DRAFT_434535 [Nemania sp. NC0429]
MSKWVLVADVSNILTSTTAADVSIISLSAATDCLPLYTNNTPWLCFPSDVVAAIHVTSSQRRKGWAPPLAFEWLLRLACDPACLSSSCDRLNVITVIWTTPGSSY